ncbi:hypothetical protein [Synechococcus sp. 1G10]|uniref:hypothetical protein n=1 Tax=Synechococcus sp. 1G10 TaxID=2025605 RepID=UPI000B98758C|nr:hypothetical protein [Synechococcus sp. 1G10]
MHWATAELTQRFEAVGTAHDDPLAAVEGLLLAHVGFLQNHPGLLRMFFAELQRPQSSPAREEGKAFMNSFRQRLASPLVAINQGLMLQGLVNSPANN